MPKKIPPILKLLRDKSNWTKGAGSRTKKGNRCVPTSPHACKWCIIGAAVKTGTDSAKVYHEIAMTIRKEFPKWETSHPYEATSPLTYIAEFNDSPRRSHEHIVRVLTAAQV